MKFLSWILRLLVFALALMFSIRNTTPVVLYGLPGIQIHAPLVVLLLVAFIMGAVFAWGCLLPSWLRARRAAHVLKHNDSVTSPKVDEVSTNQFKSLNEQSHSNPLKSNAGTGGTTDGI